MTNNIKLAKGPVGFVLVLIVLAWIVATITGKSDQLRSNIVKSGLTAVLLITLIRLALGAVGWPLFLLSGVAFVGSGAAKNVAQGFGIGSNDSTTGGSNIREQAELACSTHGGLSGYSVLPARRALCNDGSFQPF